MWPSWMTSSGPNQRQVCSMVMTLCARARAALRAALRHELRDGAPCAPAEQASIGLDERLLEASVTAQISTEDRIDAQNGAHAGSRIVAGVIEDFTELRRKRVAHVDRPTAL